MPGLALDEKMIVVAGVDGDGAPDQVGDRRHHPVQEVPVVRDEHHAAVVGGEEALQPPEGLEIQVIGRLVEQQEVRPEQEQACQRRPHAPSTGELRERTMDLLRLEPEPAEDHLGLGLEAIPAQGFEAVLDLAIPLEQGPGRPRVRPCRRPAARAGPRGARPRRSPTAPPPARSAPHCSRRPAPDSPRSRRCQCAPARRPAPPRRRECGTAWSCPRRSDRRGRCAPPARSATSKR